jgi:DNA polymerase III alpha subunit
MPDIDIDFHDRSKALELIDHIVASRIENGVVTKHNTGVYLHEAPVNALNGLCSVPYNEAEDLGYFKIDFLNVSIYKDVKNEDHLIELMNKEPLWDLLEQEEFVNMLFHVNGHSDICRQMKPRTVEELAAVLAVIRPAKRHLLGKTWKEVLENVWVKPSNGDYYFKKSHSLAYACAIVVQMNLICEQLELTDNL